MAQRAGGGARLASQVVLLAFQLRILTDSRSRETWRRPTGLAIILISAGTSPIWPQLEDAPVRGFIPKSRLDGAAIMEMIG